LQIYFAPWPAGPAGRNPLIPGPLARDTLIGLVFLRVAAGAQPFAVFRLPRDNCPVALWKRAKL